MKHHIKFIFILILLCNLGCKKQDEFLDAKPNDALAVPSTLADLQSLLSNDFTFNMADPSLGEISTDDIYLTSARWAGLASFNVPQEMNAYVWAKLIANPGTTITSWSGPYLQVYYANVVLDALPGIKYPATQQAIADQIKGSALFYRSIAFYNLLQTFALPYSGKTANVTPGIPLRLNSDINIKVNRATISEGYQQIFKDLSIAQGLLPAHAQYLTQPSQQAVSALRARIYLGIGDYANAMIYANATLQTKSDLTDYNILKPTNYGLSTDFLNEDIYHTNLEGAISTTVNFRSNTDTMLYRSYADNDLRKTVFYMIKNSLPVFRGTYDTKSGTYSGLATDEMYLIRAECYARSGNTAAAMSDLNTLLVKRWKTGTFVPFVAGSPGEALQKILLERRKELVFRGLRWTDLRRLNQEPEFATTLSRIINGTVYTLPPNDPRYAMPLPDDEIQLDGLVQNQR